ncbi:MAG: hypothetical protein ACPLPR_01265 [Bacillota bacterium]
MYLKKALTFADPIEAEGYCVVPAVVMKDPRTSVGAKAVYILLRHYAAMWGVYPGEGELAADLGVTKQQVRKWMEELISLDLVRCVEDSDAGREANGDGEVAG